MFGFWREVAAPGMGGHLKVLKELESFGHNPQASPPDAEKLQDWEHELVGMGLDGNRIFCC